jgi:hypothetical protein
MNSAPTSWPASAELAQKHLDFQRLLHRLLAGQG